MGKKLIEVALPLELINVASAREKSIRHGHPSTLHLWWARRPLAAARAVLFAQMVDDPSAHPELFPTEEDQHIERERLFRIIEELVKWENTTNQDLMNQAHQEIFRSWTLTCQENENHPRAKELFDPDRLPAFHDPFAGGGAIPLEAQRLGLESYASDLNPVAVLINKAMIEIPPKFSGQPPVNPKAQHQGGVFPNNYHGATGLSEDVSYYGQRMKEEAEKKIGQFYPKVLVTEEMTESRPDLKQYLGKELTVIAYLWARTVHSPNPAFSKVEVPLVSSFALSTKKGKEAWVDPIIRSDQSGYDFQVKIGGTPRIGGTMQPRKGGICLMSGSPISLEYIRSEGISGNIGTRLMAVVCEGDRARVYITPSADLQEGVELNEPQWKPDLELAHNPRYHTTPLYGMSHYADLFTPRQLLALTTFSDLIKEIIPEVEKNALVAGLSDDGIGIAAGGRGAKAYAQAVGVYLAFAVDKAANYWSSLCGWNSGREAVTSTFGRQAIPMVWDFAEGNPISESSGNFTMGTKHGSKLLSLLPPNTPGDASQFDGQTQVISADKIISTDPPYYDNIGYADLSDFFYVWLRHSLSEIYPDLFATLAVPKSEELVATPYRHGSKDEAQKFFMEGMTQAMSQLAKLSHPGVPVTIYYAFKQSESDSESGTASTGWETFLEAVVTAGFAITGTWPMRTEYTGNLKSKVNALATSIVLVCRQQQHDASVASRRDFITGLKEEFPKAFIRLQEANIAPVDLAQAAIGPGMAIYTKYSKVLNADGTTLNIREALSLINETLDEALSAQEGDFDTDTRWAISWFDQFGFDAGEYGIAETLSKAKNTSVQGLVEGGILEARQGRVRLLRPSELMENWDPAKDKRISTWEILHYFIRTLEASGEEATAVLASKVRDNGDEARELAYRMYVVSERRSRAPDALSYNALVQSWPEISRLARAQSTFETDATFADRLI